MLQVFAIGIAVLGISACTPNRAQDAQETAANQNESALTDDQNEATLTSNRPAKDAEFLVFAAESNLQEISLGKLAQEKGTIIHVKELGAAMQAHHETAMDDLTALAQTKMITIPSTIAEGGIDAYDDLNEESGAEFDKAYADLMVEMHEDTIDRYEKAAEDSDDADIKAMASAALPTLRTHLEQSVACQEACEKAKSL